MPSVAELLQLAVQHHRAGELHLAEPLYRQALQAAPDNAHTRHLLGLLAHQAGHNEAALTLIREAIALGPAAAAFHSGLGAVLRATGQTAEAQASFADALRLDANYVDAHNNLGVILMEEGRPEEALAYYRQALRINPNYADAHYNQGLALMNLGRPHEAVACFGHALDINPQRADAQTNLGNAFEALGRLQEALLCYRRALGINPKNVEAHNNLGMALMRLSQLAAAEASFDQAILLKSGHVVARYNRALLRLLNGDWAEGWADYEYRWKQPGLAPRQFARPRWAGEPLHGKTILVYAEQGLGDTLQFIRYAPWVQERGGRVLFECQPSLVRLLEGLSGVDQILAAGSTLPACDVQAALLSLPGIFGTTVPTIPTRVPYLRADPERAQRWRKELDGTAGFTVGIAWQGSRTNASDRYRSIPLEQFAPLSRVPGVRLLSLQKGAGLEQLTNISFPVAVLDHLDEGGAAFLDTAAVMMNLDLVVAADTAAAHLAGALGVPVWVALSVAPDWRWLLDRSDSPWYPTMRLFRQSRQGDWSTVFEQIADLLANPRGGSN